MKSYFLITFFLIKVPLAYAQGWELKKNKEGIKVYTQRNPTSPFNLLKAECEVESSVGAVLKLIFDVKQHTSWVYNSIQSVPIKKISDTEIIYYGETYAPWPVSNRDLVIHMKASHDSISQIYTVQAVSEPKLKPTVPGKIRVPRSVSIWKLIPLKSGGTRIIYTLDIDPGGSLPAWLVNFASVEGPYLSFIKMKAILNKKQGN